MRKVSKIKKERKIKKSILDPYIDEIKYLVDLGITVSNIAKLINEKAPIRLTVSNYRNFIKKRIL